MPATAEMEVVELERSDRIAIMRVEGRLDAMTARTLVRRCARIQAQGRNLIINLAGVTFLGSTGVGALLVLTEEFQQQAGIVRFAAASPTVCAVIDLLDLDDCLILDPSEEAAIAALERGR